MARQSGTEGLAVNSICPQDPGWRLTRCPIHVDHLERPLPNAVCAADLALQYRRLMVIHLAETRPNRIARKTLTLPAKTPTGVRRDDCVIGSTAILTHLIEGVEHRSTSEVHEIADTLLRKQGEVPSWESYRATTQNDVLGLA